MKDKFIGLIFGIALTLITMFIQTNTSLFASKIQILTKEPPDIDIIDKKSTNNNLVFLFESKFLVENYGYKSGRLAKVLLAPSDLRVTPKVKVVSFYRGEISPFETKWATITAIVYLEREDIRETNGVRFEFYDENEAYVGTIDTSFDLSSAKTGSIE